MTISLATDRILETLGPEGKHWAKGSWRSGDSMCLHGAIRACQPVPGDAYLIEQIADVYGWGTEFNDRSDTSWADIREAIGEHREITDAEIEATFGPSWRLVVPVVRQAAVMTQDQANRLVAARAATDADAAWVAAWDAAWVADRGGDRVAARAATDADAAQVAAWSAAWVADRGGDRVAARAATDADAAQVAAWDAAGVAAGVAAGEAAGDAAVAVAGRHLVGQHGFTRQHWDTLTAPWVSVFGPLEPLADPGSDQ